MTEDTETLTLEPAKHGKLGVIRCCVTREGFIANPGRAYPATGTAVARTYQRTDRYRTAGVCGWTAL